MVPITGRASSVLVFLEVSKQNREGRGGGGGGSFSSLALLSSSVSMANLSYLLATTFSSLRHLSNSLWSPRFNLLRVARRCFLWFLISRLILSLSFLCLQSLKLCLLIIYRRNYVDQMRACSKSVLGGKTRPVTPLLFISTIR